MNTPSKCTKCLHKAVCCKAPIMLQVEEYVEKLNYYTEIEAGKVEFKTNSFESKYRQTLKKDAGVSIVAVCDNYLDKEDY